MNLGLVRGHWTLIAGSVGVLTVMVSVAAITGVMSGSHQTYVTASGQPTSASVEVQEHADSVFESFGGTQRQRDAAGVIQAWVLNGAMDQCMAAAGFPQWDWSKTRNIAPRTNALATSVFFGAPLAHSYSNALVDMAESSRAEDALRHTDLTKDEDDAVGRCLDSTPESSDDDADGAATPRTARDLRDEWWRLVQALDLKYGNLADYRKCFVSASDGVAGDLQADGDTWKVQLAGIAPTGPQTPISLTDELVKSPEWRAFIDAESALEAVDWECRSAVYAENLDSVDAAITDFAAAHKVEIELAQEGWVATEKRAAILGFRGQDGSLNEAE